jgi:SAM-dependent methyltransferase
MSVYDPQRRGDADAYARYLRGMDASMRQKVALTAAHLLCEGRVADMGMGSGAGSRALAALYPALEVVGVDVDEAMVEGAAAHHPLPNLSFVVGDVATPVFPPESLDGIFDSSVLHHVTSFNGYASERATDALAVQARQLAPHGMLIVRDFVDPGPGEVLLDLPADDGTNAPGAAVPALSTAALFERFAAEYRILSDAPGFPYTRLDEAAARPGWRRYRLAHTHAAEFVLRKDYRADWESEVKEAYTYFTQEGFEAVFAGLGLRVLASTPIRNPWIVRNRFRDRFDLFDVTGRPLEYPATNYVIVGEKVPAGAGVRFCEAARRPPLGYLHLEHHLHVETGRVMDLVRRPHRTLDIVPWFREGEEIFVLARTSYPRPILAADRDLPVSLDGSRAPHYVAEPLLVIQTDKPVGLTVEECLAADAGLGPERLRGFLPGTTYYPSPGGVQEEVRSVLVEIAPTFVSKAIGNRTGLSTGGRVRAIEARQLLRSAQVGGLPDARLEINVYDLLLRLGMDSGPWIGETIEIPEGPAPGRVATRSALQSAPARRRFVRTDPPESKGFLEVHAARFEELDAAGETVAAIDLEWVAPAPLGLVTVALAPLRRHDGEVFLGLDDDDLPAAQNFRGNSNLLVAPAWRLPREVTSMTPALDWIRERLRVEYGATAGEIFELGGRYHPSPGVTPEEVHPFAAVIVEERPAARALSWVRLAEAVAHRHALVDGHLRIVALRVAHAVSQG